ncbi:alpha/beta hydrolase family protein [Rhodococcus sp. NPDC057014]|uniref:alpha/beta hydrolase family protein n=1 Tax=Rhodococcus sp. NPDC057014 TaxID=3346000 RepID=UPI00363E2287
MRESTKFDYEEETLSSQPPVLTPEHEMLNWGRLILDGVPYADIVGARDRPSDQGWFEYWMSRADDYESLGDESVRAAHTLSAGEYFYLAAICVQYAQFLWFDDKRAHGQRRKVELYRKAAPYLTPAAELVELSVDGTPMPVFLRVPEGAGPHPVVVLLGGLESTKEESRLMEDLLLARGMATATFDGPGQGEMFVHRELSGDFERYTSTVIDYLVSREDLQSDAVGVLGRSLGGNYALKSAACDQRVAACVCWGGFADMDSWDTETPMTMESWRYVSKVKTLDEAQVHVHQALETRDVLDRLTCPTYILHGMLDEIPSSFLKTLREHAVNAPLTIVVEDEGDHCCHNLGPRPRFQMADWLADHLVTTDDSPTKEHTDG